MCVKTSFILFLCLFLHACSDRSFALTSSISHKKSQPHKIEEKLKFKKFNPNGRLTFGHSMHPTSAGGLCKENEAIKGGSKDDCKSSLHKALQHETKSKGSRWPHLNVRDMDQHTTIFREEDLTETDYQPPHRKSPIHNK